MADKPGKGLFEKLLKIISKAECPPVCPTKISKTVPIIGEESPCCGAAVYQKSTGRTIFSQKYCSYCKQPIVGMLY